MTAKKKLTKEKKIKRALEIAEELKGLKLSMDQLKEVAGGSVGNWVQTSNGAIYNTKTKKTISMKQASKMMDADPNKYAKELNMNS